MQHALEMLKDDHSRMRSIFSRLISEEPLQAEMRELLVKQLEKEIKIHALLEEEIFYPAFKDATGSKEDNDLYYEAIEEHHVVDMVLPELRSMGGDHKRFHAKAKVVKELVEHHADEEEKEMFIKAQQKMGQARLMDVGQQMAERRQELEKQWNSPAGIVRKVQSVVDKFMPTSVKDARVEAARRKENR